MVQNRLAEIAQALVPAGKGILAADESSSTIIKRFASIDADSTVENRRFYRELLFTTSGIEEFISGVILYDETIRQSSSHGNLMPVILSDKGIIPGIKADTGLKDHSGFTGEQVTEGLDGLYDRLSEYRELGAQFAKWRAVITIGDGLPTSGNIEANAHQLARYAALSQEVGLVPIVEPEVLMEGDHGIRVCEQTTERTLAVVYDQLHRQRVDLEGTLLKPNMVLSGSGCLNQASVEEVAEATIRCFRRTVPAAVPGIVFLSGGQSPELATAHLNAMNAIGGAPWQLSFSYGRALQETALKEWNGETDNSDAAQKEFLFRAKLNGMARYGDYTEAMEKEVD